MQARSAQLSIIISVHNAEAFLTACLDSISRQGPADLEIIAVDDASTDGSFEILDRYAERDCRLRIIRLERNVGAGGARNAGLEVASGDYVWFVDSDDWIASDALATLANTIEARRPDVLLFGWERVYPGGRISDCPARSKLEQAPGTFQLHEWPMAINILHTPWNKIVRRELLLRTCFGFPSGWYQDLPYTYLALAAATRISAIPKTLIFYRQHSGGAMQTSSSRHQVVFEQWSSVFDLVAAHGLNPDALKRPLFDRMIWHLLEVAKKPERVPPEARRNYAAGVRRNWRSHLPPGYRYPKGLMGLQFRIVSRAPGLVAAIPVLAKARAGWRRMIGLPARRTELAPGSNAAPAER